MKKTVGKTKPFFLKFVNFKKYPNLKSRGILWSERRYQLQKCARLGWLNENMRDEILRSIAVYFDHSLCKADAPPEVRWKNFVQKRKHMDLVVLL